MKVLIFLVLVVSLVGCGKDLKEKAMTEKNLEEVKTNTELEQKEKELLMGYMFRKGFQKAFSGNETLNIFDSTITIGEAIVLQKNWIIEDSIKRVEEKRLAEEQLAKKEAELAKLKNVVIVSLLKKDFVKLKYDEYNTISYSIKNNSDKTIKGCKGSLILNDMFGDQIIRLEIKIDDPIKAGQRIIKDGAYSYNQFMDSHDTFRYTPLEKIETVWEPQVIIFNDGTKLELP